MKVWQPSGKLELSLFVSEWFLVVPEGWSHLGVPVAWAAFGGVLPQTAPFALAWTAVGLAGVSLVSCQLSLIISARWGTHSPQLWNVSSHWLTNAARAEFQRFPCALLVQCLNNPRVKRRAEVKMRKREYMHIFHTECWALPKAMKYLSVCPMENRSTVSATAVPAMRLVRKF